MEDRKLTIRIPSAELKRLKILALQRNTSLQALVLSALKAVK